MDPIKEAFSKVKEDMDVLKMEIEEMRSSLVDLCGIIEKIAKKIEETKQNNLQDIPTQESETQTIQQIIPAQNYPFKPLNPQNIPFSTGNRGVPADRQTHQQTDKQAENSIESAAKMLKSLDNLKEEIKQKFKKLTEQEWIVFSTIYQLDNEAGFSDYRGLAERLKLTESSIRDYVARLIKKGIPVDKTKVNDKEIRLNVSQHLKQIASLSAILTLREL